MPITQIQENHDYPTRIQNEIHQPKFKHDYTQMHLRYNLPKTINETPEYILEKINTHCLKGFTNYIKKRPH